MAKSMSARLLLLLPRLKPMLLCVVVSEAVNSTYPLPEERSCAECAPELLHPPQFSWSELPLTWTLTLSVHITFWGEKVALILCRDPATVTVTGAEVVRLPSASLATAVNV